MNERVEALRLAIEHVGRVASAAEVVTTAAKFYAFLSQPAAPGGDSVQSVTAARAVVPKGTELLPYV